MVNTRIDQMEKELKKLKEQPKGGNTSQLDLNDTFGNNKSIGMDMSPLKPSGKDAAPTASIFPLI